ncbi:Alpha/Beta hydrolase protein [Mycena albidolilacea]|uniref:Carboxylic ester hydrolase n=1 Tax=Mycena albidolilacea TaxID=1033008 RepID=A0AAD6Z3J3_9AGAR|nr:Alpha/Beta hydrolase protein [Mycena albidolilacea]
MHSLLLTVLSSLTLRFTGVFAAPSGPTVSIPYGTFQGTTRENVTMFLGVPFAQAGRFEPPKTPKLLHGVQNASEFGPACPQQKTTPIPLGSPPTYPSVSEECLTLDVYKPALDPASKLPVLVYIFGGGWDIGNSRDVDMFPIVTRSLELDEPVIVVAINYRLTAFGFLASKEVSSAGISNLGLRDQIFALEWVQKHISAFGGDPARVVIGGQSAGAISSSLLLLSNKQKSNALFRGAVLLSGTAEVLPSLDDGQPDYDGLVAANNCTAASDTLDCLRRVPFDAFMATINKTPDLFSYRSLSLVWRPRVDGDLVLQDPLTSVSQGAYAKIPALVGNDDDEGTIFSFSAPNVTTDAEFLEYVHSNYLPTSTPEEIARIGTFYPEDPTKGAPFDTGTAYQVTPEYKRLSAFLSDFGFFAPRRFFLEHISRTQDAWSWLYKRGKDTELGAYHGIDLPFWFNGNAGEPTTGVDALINFINTLDPNRSSARLNARQPSIFWPKYKPSAGSSNSSLLTFSDPDKVNITADNFRVDAIEFLNGLLLKEALVG